MLNGDKNIIMNQDENTYINLHRLSLLSFIIVAIDLFIKAILQNQALEQWWYILIYTISLIALLEYESFKGNKMPKRTKLFLLFMPGGLSLLAHIGFLFESYNFKSITIVLIIYITFIFKRMISCISFKIKKKISRSLLKSSISIPIIISKRIKVIFKQFLVSGGISLISIILLSIILEEECKDFFNIAQKLVVITLFLNTPNLLFSLFKVK